MATTQRTETTEDRALREILRRQGPPPFWVGLFIAFVKVWYFVYDCINFIPYEIFSPPTEKLRKSNRIKARPLEADNAGSPWRNVENGTDGLLNRSFEDCGTVDQFWKKLVENYGDGDCLGTREVVKVHQEQQPNGRIFEKLELGEYLWESYESADERITAIGNGLAELGHNRKENLVIFADTRAEWMLTALACFRRGFPVVTVYATLGEEAIAHAINETKSSTIVTAAELVPKIQSVVAQCPSLERAIYFLPIDPEAGEPDVSTLTKSCQHVLSLDELEEKGEDNVHSMDAILPSDLGLIMYTSGTTGLPKGVMISHANIIAAVAGLAEAVPIISTEDTIIAYLPLAHILELVAELTCLSKGCKLGYSTPLTLHDRASKIRKGTHGDCYALQPTLLAAVPAIMDRIFKAVSDEMASSPRILQEFFRLNYERKRNRLEDGYDSPFMNRIVFKRLRALLGGRLKGILCGGASLNTETQRFMNICFCCPVLQGYGLTETCAAASVADVWDLTTGSVGPPARCCDIMLSAWTEAGYTPDNDPPQGEILIGGGNVAEGYYKNPEKTAEDFLMINGIRWFCTGDIGEFRADGSLKIIDRKKDLVKLSSGEYVSLARIETHLLTAPLVDNVCVFGNSQYSFLIALVVPSQKKLETLAKQMNIDTSDWGTLCENSEINKTVLNQLSDHAIKHKLNKWEVPTKIYLSTDVWTPDSGLLTEALKLKRKPIEKRYLEVIRKFYD